MELFQLSISQLQKRLRANETTVREVSQSFLDRISRLDPKINSFIQVNDQLLDQAEALDKTGDKSLPLFGVPIAVKDNFCVKGLKTTAGSKILGDFASPYTAHCIERLQTAGALIVGKTNLDEFAMGSSNETSYYGPCRNPWDTKRVPGGSSGGSAAAMAAKLAMVTIGSDTGGSIRQPASFCGVVGMKPTYGSVSRYGLIGYASSLDQAGCFAGDVSDLASTMDVMIHKDSRDATNVDRSQGLLNGLQPASLSGVKIGIPKEYWNDELSASTREVLDRCVEQLEEQGCEIKSVSLPHSSYAIPTYYLIAASEASSNLSRYDGVRYGKRDVEKQDGQQISDLAEFYKLTRSRGFGDEAKRRILLGTFALSSGYQDAYFKKACQVRRLISNDFTNAFKECDYVIGPVASESAFELEGKIKDPIAMYYNDLYTTPVNLAGLPALSLPVGLDTKGLPVGLQVIAPSFCEGRMLEFSLAVENLMAFKEVPNVF